MFSSSRLLFFVVATLAIFAEPSSAKKTKYKKDPQYQNYILTDTSFNKFVGEDSPHTFIMVYFHDSRDKRHTGKFEDFKKAAVKVSIVGSPLSVASVDRGSIGTEETIAKYNMDEELASGPQLRVFKRGNIHSPQRLPSAGTEREFSGLMERVVRADPTDALKELALTALAELAGLSNEVKLALVLPSTLVLVLCILCCCCCGRSKKKSKST